MTNTWTDDPAWPEEGDWQAYPSLVTTTLRVATWNIWWKFGPWRARMDAIVATLEPVAPDLLCLQEVWGTEQTNAAQIIAERLGYSSVVFHPAHQQWGSDFGNAVVSRWPISSETTSVLPATPGDPEDRLVSRVDIDGPRGTVQLFNTHLAWRLHESASRQDQVRAIAQFVANSPDRSFPALLCGDFNADPDSDEVRQLTGRADIGVANVVFFDAWARLRQQSETGPLDAGHTWSTDNEYASDDLEGNRRIDYIFCGYPKAGGRGNPVAIDRIGTTPVNGVTPSDHFGLVANIRY